MIEIVERMYSVAEVASLIGHRQEYVRAMIESGKLSGVRPSAPSGFGQWRIYPDSLRKWLGVPAPSEKSVSRKARADADWLDRMSSSRPRQSSRAFAKPQIPDLGIDVNHPPVQMPQQRR